MDMQHQTGLPNQMNMQDQTGLPNQMNIQDQIGLPNRMNVQDQIGLPNQMNMQGQTSNPDYEPNANANTNIQKLPDMYLENPPYTSDLVHTYTIKEGTILYHATSNKRGFNTKYIELGNDKLINFFTPNFRLASDKIEGCSVDKQNGYIHVFRVVKPIPNIYIKLPYDIADDISSGKLANEFCTQNQNYYGIGFFYPKNNIEMFSNLQSEQIQTQQIQTQFPDIATLDSNYYSEFGLCNTKPFIEYLYSQRCQSLRKLSDPYRFNS